MRWRRDRRGRSARGPSPWHAVATACVCLVALTGASDATAPEGTPTPAAPSPPSATPSYGARPAHHGDPDLPLGAYLHTVETGMLVTDGVEILNFEREGARFLVYATDLVPTTGGTLTAASRAAEVSGAGAWLSFPEEQIYVPPRSSVVAPFELRVPVGTPPETYGAAVLIERDVDEGSATITSRTRIALRVNIEVLGAIDLQAVVGQLTWTRAEGGIRFTVPVENTGSVTFAAGGSVVLSDGSATGLPLTPVESETTPGETVELRTVWTDPPWLGRIVAQPVIEATVGDRPPREFVGDEATFWIVPWRDLGLLAGGLAGLLVLLWATRGPRRRWQDRRREERQAVRELRARRRATQAGSAREPVGTGGGG